MWRNAHHLHSAEQAAHIGVASSVEWLNITYNDPTVKRKVEALCGKPIGLLEAIRRGGVGSPRMVLVAADHGLLEPFDREEDRRFFSMEVRSEGVLLRCRSRLETLGLPLGTGTLKELVLEVPGGRPYADLNIALANGAGLQLQLASEHWGTVSKMLRKALPEGRFRTKARMM